MLSLTRWSPLAEMNNLHRDLERAFGLSWDHFPAERDRAWVPATEVTSDNGGWKMRMALPGIDPKDVQVDLHRDVLTITGERNLQRAEQTEQHLSEFGYGRFERSFTLPAPLGVRLRSLRAQLHAAGSRRYRTRQRGVRARNARDHAADGRGREAAAHRDLRRGRPDDRVACSSAEGRRPHGRRPRRIVPLSFERERNVTPIAPPRNVTRRTTSRRIPVRVRGEGWLDKARRVLGRLGLRTGA